MGGANTGGAGTQGFGLLVPVYRCQSGVAGYACQGGVYFVESSTRTSPMNWLEPVAPVTVTPRFFGPPAADAYTCVPLTSNAPAPFFAIVPTLVCPSPQSIVAW